LFYVDSRTPEITVAVKPDARGQGIGGTLIEALFAEARRRGIGLCLNVRHDNPARRLYERAGFRLLPGCGFPNRVGGTSFGMIWPGSGIRDDLARVGQFIRPLPVTPARRP
jgi:GNAT superfamily N-acetyltransferase